MGFSGSRVSCLANKQSKANNVFMIIPRRCWATKDNDSMYIFQMQERQVQVVVPPHYDGREKLCVIISRQAKRLETILHIQTDPSTPQSFR